ncbi:hypothetical protein SCA03_24020 [Streptomyces cacaoi]|uniref:Uncharacterized protein n=1 Tax=Streptomyces cacaoi TaxID=1898 RepID=A0A4Y3QX89_STRCI|nr:hypothetical protein SCA03_24020 [Streptomyces cacaoi]
MPVEWPVPAVAVAAVPAPGGAVAVETVAAGCAVAVVAEVLAVVEAVVEAVVKVVNSRRGSGCSRW